MGKIFLVGLGPGDKAQMTGRAREAIADSEVIIGYKTYVRLVTDLLDGKQVVEKGMAEELDRCTEALDLARAGKTVALISSGDVGVFGMAGPMYEVLLESGWQEGEIDIEVVPGVSALSSCAALAGAPLTHDFCAISLSDLLTPWPVIARRLNGAAQADFVTALYNPKSSRRPKQVAHAQALFLRHRSAETPVALVRAAFRKRQQVVLTTLGEMHQHEITMLTTVIIGNSNSFVANGRMVTPRGYRNKYERDTNAVRAGEQAGRPLSSGLQGWTEGLLNRLAEGADLRNLAEEQRIPLAHLADLLVETHREGIEIRCHESHQIPPHLGDNQALSLGLPISHAQWLDTAIKELPRIEGEGLGVEVQGQSLQWAQSDLDQWISISTESAQTSYLVDRQGNAVLRIRQVA